MLSYMYDTSGKLIGRVKGSGTSGTTTQFLYANPNAPYELTASKNANETTFYFYNTKGNLVGFTRNDVKYFVGTDSLGSPRIILTEAGTVVKKINYSAFGEILEETNTEFQIPFGFAGGIFDVETKLVRFGFRDYDPATGRWTARDPILFEGGQGNLYVYVGNSPIDFTDRSGLEVEIMVWKNYGVGASALGHVSARVDHKSYSQDGNGMHNQTWEVYKSQGNNPARGYDGYKIKLSPQQEKAFEKSLKSEVGEYNLLTNNCSDVVERALQSAGVDVGNPITPTQLGKKLKKITGK